MIKDEGTYEPELKIMYGVSYSPCQGEHDLFLFSKEKDAEETYEYLRKEGKPYLDYHGRMIFENRFLVYTKESFDDISIMEKSLPQLEKDRIETENDIEKNIEKLREKLTKKEIEFLKQNILSL